jgi:hypothetical protein
MMLKVFALHGILALATVLAALAGPLQKEYVAADARWLLHLDVENLQTTKIGEFIAHEFLDKGFAKPTRDFARELQFEFDWKKIQSVTAYGTSYDSRAGINGVLLLRTSMEVEKLLDGIVAKLAAAAAEGPLKKTETGNGVVYSFKDEVFGVITRGVLLISKSKMELEKARAVVLGQEANLTKATTFSTLPAATSGFFLLGAAEGFSTADLPRQAKVLKSAEGGHIVLGETQGRCFIDLALLAKDAEAAQQIQQVGQGLMALAALNEGENKDWQALIRGLKIDSSDKRVTVKLELPAAAMIAKLKDEHQKHRDR